MKSKKKKIIIGICITIIVCIIISGIYFAISFFNVIGKGLDEIGNKIDHYKESEQAREDIYNSIVTKLSQNNLIPSNWKYVYDGYGWGMESIDRSDKYYFYIDNGNYEKYKHYLLEDVDKTKYREGYNRDLWEFGDYIFHAININDLSYISDIDYGNVHMSKNKTYYLVQIYDNAIYYEYISNYKDENNYSTGSNFKLNYDSLSNEYIFYLENGQLIMEKLIRN